jgi:hypothetical protein
MMIMLKIKYTLILIFLGLKLNAQTYFSDNFSSGNLNNWTLIDSDGDGNNWFTFNTGVSTQGTVATSASWDSNTVLFPDNWMISSAIDLTSASGTIILEWKAYGQDQSWALENYTVYVATASDTASLSASSTTFNEVIGPTGADNYVQRTLDVSSFAGQSIYIGFRHHNVSDQFRINIDDVKVSTPPNLDASLEELSLNRYSLTSIDNQLTFDVYNNGNTTISSLEINWKDGTNDHIQTIPVSIDPGQTLTVDHPTLLNYSSVVEKNIVVSINKVNGSVDGDVNNNSLETKFNTISQAGTTRVVIEQQTGTWCEWCPRGDVGMSHMKNTYPDNVVLTAVHASDPMEFPEYANGINGIIGLNYPDAAINRRFSADPGIQGLETAFSSEINAVVPVELNFTATLNGSTLSIDASATFFTNFSNANLRLGVIITEDNVTGTTADYAQVNIYAGGSNGPMGGYESLPNPVPASQMVYNYVGRALLGGFDGEAGSVPTLITDGDVATYTFTYNIPSIIDQNNMHVSVLLIDGNDGSAISGIQKTLNQVLSVQENNLISGVSVYPNPAKDVIRVNLEQSAGDYNVAIYDLLGRQVISNSFNNLNGSNELEIPINSLSNGQYLIKLTNKDNSYATKFIKQ